MYSTVSFTVTQCRHFLVGLPTSVTVLDGRELVLSEVHHSYVIVTSDMPRGIVEPPATFWVID